MSAYRCCECGKVFDEPIEQYEYSEYWGIGRTTGFFVSPCCKGAFDEYRDLGEEEDCEEDDNDVI